MAREGAGAGRGGSSDGHKGEGQPRLASAVLSPGPGRHNVAPREPRRTSLPRPHHCDCETSVYDKCRALRIRDNILLVGAHHSQTVWLLFQNGWTDKNCKQDARARSQVSWTKFRIIRLSCWSRQSVGLHYVICLTNSLFTNVNMTM